MRNAKRYCIVANPASGSIPLKNRQSELRRAAAILQAEIFGLDTGSAQELVQCAREQAGRCDVLIVAGGDGTFSQVANAVDLSNTILAFMPFGTGNALTHALNYRGGITEIAHRILGGGIHQCDLVSCDEKRKAFMVSLGIDGTAIRLYEQYRRMGYQGLGAHVRAGLKAFFHEYHPVGGSISMDGSEWREEKLYSLIVVKQPFFGMGLKVVPRARWSDGRLHSVAIGSGWPGLLTGLITGFTVGNRVGEYRSGKHLTVRLDSPLALQVDGESGWISDRFSFTVLPEAMRLKY